MGGSATPEFAPRSENVRNDTIVEGGSVQIAGSSYDMEGEYEIVLTGQSYTGCDSTIQLKLTVLPPDQQLEQGFPNTFTPDGDGLNDFFVIPALQDNPQNFPESEFIVFNRDGRVLYQSKPYNNDWGGTTSNGAALPADTYFFVFRFDDNGREVVKRGRVLLIR